MCKHLDNVDNINDMVLTKKLSTTRWPFRYDVRKALSLGYIQIKNALKEIFEDPIQKQEARHESSSILKKIGILEFAFMICMWTPILKRFNATSVTLQSPTIDLSIVAKLCESLESYIMDIRNYFDNFLLEAQKIRGKKILRLPQKEEATFFVETLTEEVSFEGADKMKNYVILVILDNLINDLVVRKLSYSKINQDFGFFLNLEKENIETIRKCAENLIKIYPHDIENDFIEELVQFKGIINNFSVEKIHLC